MNNKFFLGFLISGIAIIMPLISYGATNDVVEVEEVENLVSEQVNEDVELDQNITANDLDISEQNILPSNPFYFFKSGWRGVQSAFTFNAVKKAELKLRFADERLIEAKKMAELLDSERASQLVEKAIEKYEKEIQKVKERIENFKDIDKEKAEKFVERFTDHQIKQQKLIDRIENKLIEKGVSQDKIDRIIEHKERAIEHFANGVLKVINPEELKEKLEKAMEEAQGSDFKHFKNLEILKNLEERVPEEAREAIIKAQENAKKRLNNVLESNENNERFKNFINDIGGDELLKLKIIEGIDIDNFNVKKVLDEVRTKTLDKVRDRIEGIEDEEEKEKLFKRLENGRIDNIQVIDRLRNILSEDAKERLIEVKERAIENLGNNIERISTPEERERVLKEIRKIKDIDVLNRVKTKMENNVLLPQNNSAGNMQRATNFGIDKATDVARNIKDRAIDIKDNINDKTRDAIPENVKNMREIKVNEKGIFNEIDKKKIELERVKDLARDNIENVKDVLIEKADQLRDSIEAN